MLNILSFHGISTIEIHQPDRLKDTAWIDVKFIGREGQTFTVTCFAEHGEPMPPQVRFVPNEADRRKAIMDARPAQSTDSSRTSCADFDDIPF
jgi:hypothetical protein